MVANEQVQSEGAISINLLGYVQHRFDQGNKESAEIQSKLPEIFVVVKGLKDGLNGCGNHNVDMGALKAVHKKLKRCRAWGVSEKKTKKKRKGDDGIGETVEPDLKKVKSEQE